MEKKNDCETIVLLCIKQCWGTQIPIKKYVRGGLTPERINEL